MQILLNNTRLHLKRGKRYGICGYNGCGKSTLMRAIANGQASAARTLQWLLSIYIYMNIYIYIAGKSRSGNACGRASRRSSTGSTF